MTIPHDSLEKLARAGLAVKGVVYSLIGMLSLLVALGEGGQTTGSKGAIATLAGQPFGQILLGAVALGLLAYTLWRFAQAIFDTEGQPEDAKGWVHRISYFISGLLYGGLALFATRLALGLGGSTRENADTWTAKLMSAPFGVWLVGIVGILVIGVGVYQFRRAYKAAFMEEMKTGGMDAQRRRAVERIGQFGLAARGVVFSLIGVFLIDAALSANPEEAKGLEGALDTLRQQPYGPWLLGLVAAGLVAFGLHCLVQARYRRITTG